MSLSKLWPTEANCLTCIKPEAENPSDGVFLAIHQEMRFVRKSFETNQSERKTQRQLLNDFLRDDPSGRIILPILGESGVGKSHIVRWLDVQLRQRDDRDKRHVIRIPKSSSLKSVLGRILNGLEGPRYEEIRTQLRAAREQMDDISAKHRIRAELLSAIQRKYESAMERKGQVKATGDKLGTEDVLWVGHGEPRSLPALFDDPATQKLFIQGSPSRPGIISELARHITKDTGESESPRRQFEREDFLIPDELADDIREAGVIAGKYLERLQRTTNSKSLDDAVRLLNSIVDDAIAPLATPADTSLAELFYEVRRQLLADGRELVLLVEDFAVLAGVQKALLDAIIREGETGGKTEACTIRTALAVTDGYFEGLETVKTRAIYGWRIEVIDDEDDDATVDRIGNFVAAYVNAARIGAEKLEGHYSVSRNTTKPAPNALDYIEAEGKAFSLSAEFGLSADGYSMFPFNRSAIRELADWKLRDSYGRLRFHPRSIINEIILPVVKDYRSDFERGAFPPHAFLGYPPTKIAADLQVEVLQLENDPDRRMQYLYLFRFWGGNPNRIDKANIPAGVYEAFSLQILDPKASSITPISLRGPAIGDKPSGPSISIEPFGLDAAPEGDDDSEPEQIRKLIQVLDEWRGGATLGQADANRIRAHINTHILHAIDWEAELLRPIKPATDTYARRIYLPRAKGNPPDKEKAFVLVAEDSDFENVATANAVYSSIRAMIRNEHYGTWDYPGSESDYAALANFIDQHVESSARWVRSRYKSVDGDPVPALTQTLLWQARVLNIARAQRGDDVSLLAAVLELDADRVDKDDDEEWNSFVDNLASMRARLRDELLERTAAWQGTTGKTPHAVDATQLLGPVQELKSTWKVTAKLPSASSIMSDDMKQIYEHVQHVSRVGPVKVESRRKRIAEQSKSILNELGNDYDKNELTRDLDEVCALAQQYGLTGEVTAQQFKKMTEDFRSARAKEVSKQADSIVNSPDFGSQLSAIASLDIHTHSLLIRFTETCSKFLKERLGKADSQIVAWTAEVVETKKAEVDSILEELQSSAAPYAGEVQ